jgi:hypothetical protein
MPRRIAAFVPIVAAFFLGLSVPAASAGDSIVITDNGGSLVTRAVVYPGEELTRGGIAYTVETARCEYGSCILTLAPGLPVSDEGQSLVFAVLG